MRSVASLSLVYNGERFIYPHLKMLEGVEKKLVIIPNRPFPHYKPFYSESRDRTESIITTYFPEVEILRYWVEDESDDVNYFPEAYNFGLRHLRKYDIVTKLDVDAFFTKEDWKIFISVLKNGTSGCYQLDWSKDSVDYYGEWDFDHGVYDQKEKDPIAVNPRYQFEQYFKINGPCLFLSGITMHHFRNWKSWKDVTGKQRMPSGPYVSAPKEIQEMLLEGRTICGI